MTQNNITIRKIETKDNFAIEHVIKSVFPEVKLPLTGTAYEDADTMAMYEAYQEPKAIYYVIEMNGKVAGGGGIKALKDGNRNICELQKMYFIPALRGKGLGQFLVEKCLNDAKKFGYKQCYLESASQLKAAIHIYKKMGFKHLNAPLGNTGHDACGIFMIKDL